MHYRAIPPYVYERATQGTISRAEKRRRAALAAGMLLVPFLTFGIVLGFFLITTY
jgi:hypothetical protein